MYNMPVHETHRQMLSGTNEASIQNGSPTKYLTRVPDPPYGTSHSFYKLLVPGQSKCAEGRAQEAYETGAKGQQSEATFT